MQGAATSFQVLQPVSLRRRRFLMVSVAMLGVLGIALGVSFAGTTGTTGPSVSGGSTSWVFPVANTKAVPAGVLDLKYTTAITDNLSGTETIGTAVLPNWTPIQDAAGTVTTAGDLAVIDAQGQSLLVSMYVTNLHLLQQAYTSYAFDVNVYKCASACTTQAAWTEATTVIPATDTVLLTNTEGFLQFEMPSGFYYVITIDTGGTFFAYNTSSSPNLSPAYFFSAQAI